MVTKRRFTVALVAVLVCGFVEIVAQIFGQTGGWSGTGQLALLGVVATYFGGDAARKKFENGNVEKAE